MPILQKANVLYIYYKFSTVNLITEDIGMYGWLVFNGTFTTMLYLAM